MHVQHKSCHIQINCTTKTVPYLGHDSISVEVLHARVGVGVSQTLSGQKSGAAGRGIERDQVG